MKTVWLTLALVAAMCGFVTAGHAEWTASVTPGSAAAGPGETIAYSVQIHNGYSESLTLSFAPVTFSPPLSNDTTYGTWSLAPGFPAALTLNPGEQWQRDLGSLVWDPECPYFETHGELVVSPFIETMPPRQGLSAQGDGWFWAAGGGLPPAQTATFDATCTGSGVVPEPSSLLLLGIGIPGMLALCRRRRAWRAGR